jgi:hypothetical protein
MRANDPVRGAVVEARRHPPEISHAMKPSSMSLPRTRGQKPIVTRSERIYTIGSNSRYTVPMGQDFPEAATCRFGALVESQGPSPQQIVVARAQCNDAAGVTWAAGSNARATKPR